MAIGIPLPASCGEGPGVGRAPLPEAQAIRRRPKSLTPDPSP